MKFPFVIPEPLDEGSNEVWEKVFYPTKGKKSDKTVEESLWRRTQSESNQRVSGWKNSSDMRRKIVFYRHEYDRLPGQNGSQHIALMKTFVFISLTLPEKEIDEYLASVNSGINNAGWKQINRSDRKNVYQLEDLILETVIYENPTENPNEYTTFPKGYHNLEINLYSGGFVITEELRKTIWGVMKFGFRKSLPRDNPRYLSDITQIVPYLPCQVEMGCGAAYEAGVLPLHSLHEIYSINEPFSKKFIISAANDRFFSGIISDPINIFRKTSDFFFKTVTVPLTDFYMILKQLYDKGYIVGPIITNNFDGLHLRLGLDEIFVRTYSETNIIPDINFDPKAKSLLVVGCHADRRNVEQAARSKGLKVIYIDPEGWWVDGKFIEYPLESPQHDDLVVRKGASEAFAGLIKHLD